ncbi:unnamed protein product [Bursaphelenchus xylophilus]|uniref:(pine wood nematode) hypothetical protein n=1 Tax=Bursaphelenchus xylophilus TaxID=6326 RepID=A0A1I7S6F9_BURXY|nr:unnamed protein product [Bursaphelenchus xylophilus]CAG9128036.1 unnamed protein product [Bursaphelenchus xylophilus]
MALWLTQSQFSTSKVLQNEAAEALTPNEVKDFLLHCGSDYGFIFYKDGELVFGRDIFGRKSLVGNISQDGEEIRLELTNGFFERKVIDSFEIPVGSIFHFKKFPAPTITDTSFVFKLSPHDIAPTELEITTYYDLEPEQPLLSFFKTIQVKKLDASRYLKPNSDVSAGDSERKFEPTASRLIVEVKKAIKEIFQPKLLVPSNHLNGSSEIPEQVTVSFSGGVDSLFVTVVAATVLDEVKQFNLVNTVFGKTENDFNSASDRIKGREAFEWLSEHFGPRFSMIEVNVSHSEVQECRSKIERAMLPNFTILDESLASVVWFGSRGKGKQVFYKDQKGLEFKPSSFAFCGSGSDELLGGYARHRTYFEKGGWPELLEGLEMEIGRIGARNFGRDDRITVSNGVSLIAPFMHDRFVEWMATIPLPYRVDFREPRGIGEKKLLRVALRLLGLPPHLTDTPKRAMQFGSGYAKRQNKGMKGNDRSGDL